MDARCPTGLLDCGLNKVRFVGEKVALLCFVTKTIVPNDRFRVGVARNN